MSITEYLWTRDRFLQDGRDFELGASKVLAIFCLAPVLSKSYIQSVDVLLSAVLISSLNSTIYSRRRFLSRTHFRLFADSPA